MKNSKQLKNARLLSCSLTFLNLFIVKKSVFQISVVAYINEGSPNLFPAGNKVLIVLK